MGLDSNWKIFLNLEIEAKQNMTSKQSETIIYIGDTIRELLLLLLGGEFDQISMVTEGEIKQEIHKQIEPKRSKNWKNSF